MLYILINFKQFFFMKQQFQEIRIENTNLCSNKCIICPREKLSRSKGTMSMQDFEKVMNNFQHFKGQIHLHGFGEPFLDKTLLEKVKLARKISKYSTIVIYTSLNANIENNYFSKLIEAGLSIISISFYCLDKISYQKFFSSNNFEKVVKNIKQLVKENDSKKTKIILNCFEDKTDDKFDINQNLENKKKFLLKNYKNLEIFYYQPIHNYGMGRKYNKPRFNKACSIIWGYRKRVLQITWDLNIVPCCFDFNSSVIFGNLKNQTLDEIYNNDSYSRFIFSHLMNSLSNYPICTNCERCFIE